MRLLDPIRTSLNGRPFLDYALLDFGNISNNSRYLKNNPFSGADGSLILKTEIYHNGKWYQPHRFTDGSWSLFVSASSVTEGIVIQTGVQGLSHVTSSLSGSAYSASGQITSALCRVHCVRVGV